jgi:hypothetical protein
MEFEEIIILKQKLVEKLETVGVSGLIEQSNSTVTPSHWHHVIQEAVH